MTTTATQKENANSIGFININDLSLSDEVMEGFDPEANAYAGPSPVPPGRYRVALDFAEEDTQKRWFQLEYNLDKYPGKANDDGSAKTYVKTRLVGTILDGEFEGRRVVDPFVSTGIFPNSSNPNTNSVASLLHLFGRGDDVQATGGNEGALLQLFEQAMAGKPVVSARTDWEWSGSKEAGYPRVKGIKNFPENDKGQKVHTIEDPATGESTPGYAVIKGYSRA